LRVALDLLVIRILDIRRTLIMTLHFSPTVSEMSVYFNLL